MRPIEKTSETPGIFVKIEHNIPPVQDSTIEILNLFFFSLLIMFLIILNNF